MKVRVGQMRKIFSCYKWSSISILPYKIHFSFKNRFNLYFLGLWIRIWCSTVVGRISWATSSLPFLFRETVMDYSLLFISSIFQISKYFFPKTEQNSFLLNGFKKRGGEPFKFWEKHWEILASSCIFLYWETPNT